MGEIRYKEDISIIIRNKIEKSDLLEHIKGFLNELIELELEHAYEKSSWYGHSTEYKNIIKKYSSLIS